MYLRSTIPKNSQRIHVNKKATTTTTKSTARGDFTIRHHSEPIRFDSIRFYAMYCVYCSRGDIHVDLSISPKRNDSVFKWKKLTKHILKCMRTIEPNSKTNRRDWFLHFIIFLAYMNPSTTHSPFITWRWGRKSCVNETGKN